MKKQAILFLFLVLSKANFGQPIPPLFDSIAARFPNLPTGLCAAVAFHQTRWQANLDSNQAACSGRPIPKGILGWIVNPGTVYRPHLVLVSELSGMSATEIIERPENEVFAWSKALDSLAKIQQPTQSEDWLSLAFELSELPRQNGSPSDWAAYYWLEEVAKIWRQLGGPQAEVAYFKPEIPLAGAERNGLDGVATWNPSPACNYSSRNGSAVTAVVMHTTQGSFAGALAWFMSCQSQVSCHYLIRSSDGLLLQLVNEDVKAWHVGSENAYTIGIEHEGFVSNPAWYTDTMYRVSANLVQRICGRFSMDVSRTAWWPWSAQTNYAQNQRPGACTRIKGHQHYPNQTHTDPGQHWNWARYADLIQGAKPIETLLGSSGTLVFPNQAPYSNDSLKQWLIRVPFGRVNLQFNFFNLESTWDYLTVYDGSGVSSPLLAQLTGNQLPQSILASGKEVLLRFRSDCAIAGQGFSVSWNGTVGAGEDSIPPVTQVDSLTQAWISQDFSQGFTDIDSGGSGLQSTYWNAFHHDGQGYYGRPSLGMFADFFDANTNGLHPQWTLVAGQWQQGNGQLYPLNPAQTNSVSALAPQGTQGERYWAFDFVMYPNGLQPRTSLFWVAAQSGGLGRSNSMELRIEPSGTLRVYRWEQSQPQLLAGIPVLVQGGQLQQVVICRRDSTYRFYLNQQYLGELAVPLWTSNLGQYISLETQDAVVAFEAVHSGPGRQNNSAVWVTTGLFPIGHLPNPNPNPGQPGGRILTLANDVAGNLSSWNQRDCQIDFTPPYASSWIHDGISSDLDSMYGPQWQMHWANSADPHSGVFDYEVCLGSLPGQCDIMPWISAGLNSIWGQSQTGLSPGQTYYSGVRARNAAGMLGNAVFSDGCMWLGPTGGAGSAGIARVWVGPNPFSSELTVMFEGIKAAGPVVLLDVHGKTVWAGEVPLQGNLTIRGLGNLAEGVYLLSVSGLSGVKVVKIGL